MSTYDPKSIANFFIEKAAAEGKSLTPIQVIKLTYLAHGWHLGLADEPLLNEPPEAWQYGPVIPSLYHELKAYGKNPVAGPIRRYDVKSSPNGKPGLELVVRECPPPSDGDLRRFLDSVWESYKGFSGFDLSTLTHRKGTPWQKTWEEHGAKYTKGVDIPEDMIRDHYKDLAARMHSHESKRG